MLQKIRQFNIERVALALADCLHRTAEIVTEFACIYHLYYRIPLYNIV